MDFSSQLANLQKTASAAKSRGDSNNNNDRERNNGPGNSPNRGGGGRYNNQGPPRYHDDRRRHHGGRGRPRDNSYYGRSPPHHHHQNKRQRVDGPYRSPKWNNLKRAVDTLPKYQPPAEAPPPCTHLCLLAITIDELPFEAIWREWAQRQNITISLICHAKDPSRVRSEWLLQRLMTDPPRIGRGNDFAPPIYHTRRPKWGSIEITRAMLDLCYESCKVGTDGDMKDPRFSTNRFGFSNTEGEALPKVDKVLFISETCLPVASLTEEHLNSPHSIVNSRDTPNNGFSRQLQFEKMHSLVPLKRKADQWMMLSRAHVEAILNLLPGNFWECFADCNASDELYFPTSLALLGIDDEQLEKKRITYADWSMGPKNPATFATAKELKTVVVEARKEGCLIARKFDGIELDDWKAVVYPE